MDRVPSHPVLSCAAAKAWEAGRLPDEAAEWQAMQRAGLALAAAITEDFKEIGGLPADARILVLVGKGHNGGDALLAARALLTAIPAATAEVVFCFGETTLRPLAARALADLRSSVGPRAATRLVAKGAPGLLAPGYALCLDGIFGFQFRPPMDDATADLIHAVNAHPAIRFRAAVDLPSGVGETNAPTVFRADFTYATGIVKQPVLLSAAAASVGRLRYLDLGFFDPVAKLGGPGCPGSASPATDYVLTQDILAPLAALRSSQTDKRTFGHLLVVGGSRSYPGAVVLAVRAALRSGAGLVTAFVPERLAPEYAARHPEAMWVGCPETAAGGLAGGTVDLIQARQSRATAMLMGPGMSAEPEVIETMVAIGRMSAIPLVLDADALRPEVLAAAQGRSVVCTPHAGEYERIGGRAGLRPASGSGDVVTVLKGPLTRIVSNSGGSETGPTYYSPFGGPVLARGGSGDILAGLIGGLLAQSPADPLLAACRGVVWHGRAADLLARARGQVAIELSETLEQLGPALHP
ncbi:Bifunctional NAD(P)H-hydrate repair enzyme Nnr [Lacunisphaera limnophila]|uniref:ADP-dependent (S)-NAD(P)H-hydrate dehydratase n=1 Tax=Lacunisphaera limnophila TaxID=1838286 RepID=A0A1D8AR94_9BACT|nr:NAD(P)H-hydrate dehydratase [Lacunisphaera limnophila]AOS43397.1 Bifunctional NAD(P)H-hydrate repair enzyme Nnr [Lacunisphaera limnophila]